MTAAMDAMPSEGLRSMLGSTAVLGVLAAVAMFLTLSRGSGVLDPRERRRVARLAALALLLQSAHFVEEWSSGLHERLPQLLELPPMPVTWFVAFNLFWIAVWGLSILGLKSLRRAALFPLWFLALGTAVNGIAHPLLALTQGGYFPGLWTAPLTGVAGFLLLRRLASFTRP
jgi:hypothetical protein